MMTKIERRGKVREDLRTGLSECTGLPARRRLRELDCPEVPQLSTTAGADVTSGQSHRPAYKYEKPASYESISLLTPKRPSWNHIRAFAPHLFCATDESQIYI